VSVCFFMAVSSIFLGPLMIEAMCGCLLNH
jgi:hypothetical protein